MSTFPENPNLPPESLAYVGCCSVLQCVSVCCSVLQCDAVYFFCLLLAPRIAGVCRVLQCVAVGCSVL